MARKAMRRHWYETWTEVCVLCGCETKYRERRYSHKPTQWDKRNHYREMACPEHFM